jgi:putative DNA primase/helicase
MARSYPPKEKAQSHRHEAYDGYLRSLRLGNDHFGDLAKRGLDRHQITRGLYATKKSNKSDDMQEVVGRLDGRHELDGIPGFFWNEQTKRRDHSGVMGLMIPVRDVGGNISSILVRPDKSKTGSKYLAFSSKDQPKGEKVQQTTHCPCLTGASKDVCGGTVRITEGILKADVATALGEYYCLGMHGLNVPKDLRHVIEELEVQELLISLDSGEDENSDMMQAKAALIRLAEEIGIDVYIETWDSQLGKGIDDLLQAGHKDKITRASPEEIKKVLFQGRPRPQIIVEGGGLSDEATFGEKALINAELPIYQRGAKLVTPVIQTAEASKGRQTKIAVVHEISKGRMIDYLCGAASWRKMDEEGTTYPINPPFHVAETILSRYGRWNFPRLSGVIMTPTLRPDGSILKDIGYDSVTRLYLLDSPVMPGVPDNPTRNDALDALELLEGLLVDFPFVNKASRSVALSALITPIVRGACKVVPMHGVGAPAPGTGKSYLLDTASAIATGQPCPVIAAGRTEEETEKRLGAALLTGQSLVSIDNLNGDIGGDALCQYIERPLVAIRILGKSEQVVVESRSTIFANGNNMRFTGDITRRAVLCLMDANIERPELRDFKLDPFETVLNDRGKYIAAILTIIRAYIVAGKPNPARPRLASFEEWSDLVRSALIWLGQADPMLTMEDARAEDPTLQAISEVFTALWEATKGKHLTAREIVDLALDKHTPFDAPDNLPPDELAKHREPTFPALKEALINVAADSKGFITPKRLGHWLSRHKGRICNNLRLENKADKHGHTATWWLVQAVPAEEGG